MERVRVRRSWSTQLYHAFALPFTSCALHRLQEPIPVTEIFAKDMGRAARMVIQVSLRAAPSRSVHCLEHTRLPASRHTYTWRRHLCLTYVCAILWNPSAPSHAASPLVLPAACAHHPAADYLLSPTWVHAHCLVSISMTGSNGCSQTVRMSSVLCPCFHICQLCASVHMAKRMRACVVDVCVDQQHGSKYRYTHSSPTDFLRPPFKPVYSPAMAPWRQAPKPNLTLT